MSLLGSDGESSASFFDPYTKNAVGTGHDQTLIMLDILNEIILRLLLVTTFYSVINFIIFL